jgi:hypothetical protein
MKNTIDQDDLAPDLVKSQIVVDDEGAISECHELWIVGHATGERVGSECVQTGFDMVKNFSSGPWVLLCRYETNSTKSCSAMENRRTVYLIEGTDTLPQVSHDAIERTPSVARRRLCLRHGQLPIELQRPFHLSVFRQ